MPGWEVIGLSRRTPSPIRGVRSIAVDLVDPASVEAIDPALAGATHLVYAAVSETPGLSSGWVDQAQIERNGAMLRNLFGRLQAVSPELVHVSLLHGTKAYGLHHPSLYGQYVHVPLRERDPVRKHPNFYFVQEDYLREMQAGHSWAVTVFRPTVVYGDAAGNNMNPLPVIAAYATMLRDEGSPLHFPGRSVDPVLHEAVDVDLLARALGWAATSPEAGGGTYNVTNGDVFTWQNIWSVIADTLGMVVGEHRPVSMVAEMRARGQQWAGIVDRYDLAAPRDLLDFVGDNSLVYTDMMLANTSHPHGPWLNSTIGVRQAGFNDCMDTEDMFRKWFHRLQRDGMLPPCSASAPR